jgi:hypothetical protein
VKCQQYENGIPAHVTETGTIIVKYEMNCSWLIQEEKQKLREKHFMTSVQIKHTELTI